MALHKSASVDKLFDNNKSVIHNFLDVVMNYDSIFNIKHVSILQLGWLSAVSGHYFIHLGAQCSY